MASDVDVLLADDRRLRGLNREFRAKDKATDVLSFPSMAELASHHAGDLAISYETARRQAEQHGHTLAGEIRVLMLHGLLHLGGMDHEVDSGEMAAREAELRKQFRLPAGLIARVGGGTVNAKRAKTAKTARNPKGSKAAIGRRRGVPA